MLNLPMELMNYGLIIVLCLLIIVLFKQRKGINQKLQLLESKFNTQDILINELQNEQKTLLNKLDALIENNNEQQLESVQVSKQLEHRIKVIQEKISIQDQAIEQFQAQQPEDKLYSRAFKLVELGAGIEEVIKECEIPRAEAEMLLSMHQNKISK